MSKKKPLVLSKSASPEKLILSVIEKLQTQLPGVIVDTFEDYGAVKLCKDASCQVLAEIEHVHSAGVMGDGRFEQIVDVALNCLINKSTPKAQLKVSSLASTVLMVVENNCWGLDWVGWPENLDSLPSVFDPNDDGFVHFVVTFSQSIYRGNNLIDDPVVKKLEFEIRHEDGHFWNS